MVANIENEGLFSSKECLSMSYSDFIKELRKAKETVSIYKDLPSTDEIWDYTWINDGTPYMRLIIFANEWLYKESFKVCDRQSRIRYEYMYAVVKERIKVYDNMDDIKRPYFPLYAKRIKLYHIKESLGLDSYYDIKLPPIVPPEFFSPSAP